MTPVFFGLEGPALTAGERALFGTVRPAGYILFQRNCQSPEQIRALTDSLRALDGRDRLPILIDQEGGRVARLKPPEWPAFPPGRVLGDLYLRDKTAALTAARLNAQALGQLLLGLGITVDCLPVLDVPVPGAHDVIGDRAYGLLPDVVTALGQATLDGLAEAGCVGVIKHIPGHGRAGVDSHLALPVVDTPREQLEATDFAPFRALSGAPMAMTAHVIYTALDAGRCATLSPVVIGEIIRGSIGFDGLLMSDDLGMKALAGSWADLAREVLEAGCDIVLHCSGDLAEMTAIAEALPPISAATRIRLDRAMQMVRTPYNTTDLAQLFEARDRLLA